MTKTAKGWSEERRVAQAERCRQNKPWQKSTGPKTSAGKKIVSRNAFKTGLYTKNTRALRKILREQDLYAKDLTNRLETAAKVLEKEIQTKRTSNKIKGHSPLPPAFLKSK